MYVRNMNRSALVNSVSKATAVWVKTSPSRQPEKPDGVATSKTRISNYNIVNSDRKKRKRSATGSVFNEHIKWSRMSLIISSVT